MRVISLLAKFGRSAFDENRGHCGGVRHHGEPRITGRLAELD
jgi:hypothetical protein